LAEKAVVERVTSEGRPLSHRFVNGRLSLAGLSGRSTLTLKYHVLFDDPVPGDFVGIEDPSYGVAATIMPEGTYLAEGSGWHPRVPGLDNFFTVEIVGPRNLTGVTAGRLQQYASGGTTTKTIWKTEYPQQALSLAAGPYQMLRDDLQEVQLLVFFRAENSRLAAGYLESMRKYLTLYQELIGSYPYEKFAVVENFYPTGYGLPGWTLLGSSVVRLPFIRTTSLPHEIAHAWWGNAVEIDYASGNWGEGLATYVADYYLKELKGPREAIEYRKKLLRDYASLVTSANDMPLADFRSRMSKPDQAIGYGKTAMVFHMLREQIGDEAFWQGLRTIASEGRGKRYGWADLRKHFEAVSGEDLQAFFLQWVERVGAPRLSIKDVDVIKVGSKWQVSGNIHQGKPVYNLAIPLLLETEKRQYLQTVGLYKETDCFVFTVEDRPMRLSVDPASKLFRHLYMEELPATINDLRASGSKLVVVADKANELYDASRDLLRGLQWQDATVMSEAEYLEVKPVKSDVIVLGTPQSKALLNALQETFSAAEQQFTNSAKMGTYFDVRFMVSRTSPDGPVVANFLPDSVVAAKDTARRIPHYGRYSYLAFNHGKNLVKGTWEPGESPLKVLFDKDNEE
jgi:hypothetical protein